jgi:hypothetical protein
MMSKQENNLGAANVIVFCGRSCWNGIQREKPSQLLSLDSADDGQQKQAGEQR